MCFGGGDAPRNTNIRPAGYALQDSHSQVSREASPAPPPGEGGGEKLAEGGMRESTAPYQTRPYYGPAAGLSFGGM